MPHDIIDNRNQKLVDHIRTILDSTDSARFAVGYFFLSGLESIQDKLSGVQKLRLLIGNTTNRETIEQISEGYKRLDLVEAAEEREHFLKRAEQKTRLDETAANLRKTVEVMDQTEETESLVKTLIDLIVEKRLEVRVYTKGRLHAKAYIFDYQSGAYENGIAVVGSSNLTLSGLTHNTELNVVVHGNDNHEQLGNWFDELWADGMDFESHLMDELQASWAGNIATPHDIYMKTLYALVSDRLEDEEQGDILWDSEINRQLADFQKVAVRQAIQMIKDNGGAFVSDVVGLGKSFIGAAILKHFHRMERTRGLIICPKPLEQMWIDYNSAFELNAEIVPMSMLRLDDENAMLTVLDHPKYEDREFVLIDESHNFRHHGSQRYSILQSFLAKAGRKVCLLTATPRNSSAIDVYNQIKLFHLDDVTDFPISPANLKDYFREIEAGKKKLQDLLVHVLIRRTRRHILRYYGFTEDTDKPMRTLSDTKAKHYLEGNKRAYVMVAGKKNFFPKRQLATLRYSIEDTYKGLYEKIRLRLGKPTGSRYSPKPGQELTYARYGLWHYVLPAKKKQAPYTELQTAGSNLRGLIRVMLFKRFESSVYAFRKTLERLERIHDVFLKSLDQGFVPAGQDAQKLLYDSENYDEPDLLVALQGLSGKYSLSDFDEAKLRNHLEEDKKLLGDLLQIVSEQKIPPAKDDKLQTLIKKLKKDIPKATGKVLIFTQFSDTAEYLSEQLNPGGRIREIESIHGSGKNKALVAARFSPNSNPYHKAPEKSEIRILIATDVMSEGLNLQDADVVLNYDLHWNPVRLIQRFGRIDRIGSVNDEVWGFNFLPETELEKTLGLEAVLKNRIQDIHDTIGEDDQILDKDEQVNKDAMFCIYEKKGGGNQLSLFEQEEGDFIDLNEAEEMMRSLRSDDPEEFDRIANLRDGIRSAKSTFSESGRYVFCQSGRYQQLFLLDDDDRVVTRDASDILARLKCSEDEPASVLPKGHNEKVKKVLDEIFKPEVLHRKSQQKFSTGHTVAQKYALKELRLCYAILNEEDGELKKQVAKLEVAFNRPLTAAIRKRLNVIRRNGVTGKNLLPLLTDLFIEYEMENHSAFELKFKKEQETDELPRIICSEAIL